MNASESPCLFAANALLKELPLASRSPPIFGVHEVNGGVYFDVQKREIAADDGVAAVESYIAVSILSSAATYEARVVTHQILTNVQVLSRTCRLYVHDEESSDPLIAVRLRLIP